MISIIVFSSFIVGFCLWCTFLYWMAWDWKKHHFLVVGLLSVTVALALWAIIDAGNHSLR
jgi:hypothetical protein